MLKWPYSKNRKGWEKKLRKKIYLKNGYPPASLRLQYKRKLKRKKKLKIIFLDGSQTIHHKYKQWKSNWSFVIKKMNVRIEKKK